MHNSMIDNLFFKTLDGARSLASKTSASAAWDIAFESRKWVKELPFISFPETWEVKIIPAFNYATLRFYVRLKANPRHHISIYFDAYDLLGSVGQPYWEIFPTQEGEADRFMMNQIPEMLSAIQEYLDSRPSETSQDDKL